MEPKISIIIPCFNSAITLEETLKSVHNQQFNDWEAIIINDGSTDNTESIALEWVKKDNRFKYFLKKNEGLGKTRNFGIARAKGNYILPLDSDNLVEQNFVSDAINILEKNLKIGVVHGNATFMGDKSGIWEVPHFNLEKILVQNYIDACAVYRKIHWAEVGGYDIGMPYQGNEDWDLWVAFGTKGVKFYHLNQITFKYRVSKKSMLGSYTKEIREENEKYMAKKYSQHYYNYFKSNVAKLHQLHQEPINSSIFFLKRWVINLVKL